MALLGLSITAALQLFSGGLRSARLSNEYTMAVIHARDKMDEVFWSPRQDGGTFADGYRWFAYVTPFKKADKNSAEIEMITVTVYWGSLRKERKVNLVALKAIPKDVSE